MRQSHTDAPTRIAFPRREDDPKQTWVSIGSSLHICRAEEMWQVVHGNDVLYVFAVGDRWTKRLCMAQLSLLKLATEGEIAWAFGCGARSVSRAKAEFRRGGAGALRERRRGPKGSRQEPGIESRIVRLRREGEEVAGIARSMSLPYGTVYSICKRRGVLKSVEERPMPFAFVAEAQAQATLGPANGSEENRAEPEAETGEADVAQAGTGGRTQGAQPFGEAHGGEPVEPQRLEPVEVDVPCGPAIEVGPGEPAPAREEERAFACFGVLGKPEVDPEFVSGSEVPAAGVLLAIALVPADGCLAVARRVYGRLSNGFYGLRSLLLTVLLNAWLSVKTVDGMQHGTPHLLGRLLGLDRLPEAKTIGRKFHEVEARGLAREYMRQMGEHRIQANRDASAILYVDGHVRVYHGRRRVQKKHVARQRTVAPGIQDFWVHDGTCSPLLQIPGRCDHSMIKMIPEIVRDARHAIGDDRPLTIVFDREGWSPRLFADLARENVFIITYRKHRRRNYPAREFDRQVALPDRSGGDSQAYPTRDRLTRVGRYTFRSITVLERRQHQTEIITTDPQTDAALILSRMFGRWGQENFFKYEGAHRSLDRIGTYAFEPVPADVEVPNPQRRELDAELKTAESRTEKLEAAWHSDGKPDADLPRIRWWRGHVRNLRQRRRATPERVLAGQLPAEQRPEQPTPERKLFTGALSISAQRIETQLLGMLSRHYRSSHKDGRELLRQILRNTGDTSVQGRELIVTLNALASPHQTRALAGLCSEVNALGSVFPETRLRLRFEVHEHP